MKPTVCGIDPSLTRTAVATLDPALWITASHCTKGSTDDSLTTRNGRLADITDWVAKQINIADPDLVVIEAPAPSQTTGSHHDRSGLWWRIVEMVLSDGTPLVEVTPSSLKKYATGKGNAGKDEVMIASSKRYGDRWPAANNDEADAFVLACMGMRLLGHPVEESLPQQQVEAMTKVRWAA